MTISSKLEDEPIYLRRIGDLTFMIHRVSDTEYRVLQSLSGKHTNIGTYESKERAIDRFKSVTKTAYKEIYGESYGDN